MSANSICRRQIIAYHRLRSLIDKVTDSMPSYSFRITRSDRESTKTFTVSVEPRMTVLDGLFLVQREQDPTLSFRCSCRVGMCGTCAMMINWQPRLACQTRLVTLKSDTIVVEPLIHMPVLKDLVVSLEPFFNQWRKVRPALHPANRNSKTLAIVPPDSEFGQQCAQSGLHHLRHCYAACGFTGESSRYLGPAAINKGLLRLLDPRNSFVDERLEVLERRARWCVAVSHAVQLCRSVPQGDQLDRFHRAAEARRWRTRADFTIS